MGCNRFFTGYLQPKDSEVSCERCGRTPQEANIYTNAEVGYDQANSKIAWGTYCKECRDELKAQYRLDRAAKC